MLCKRIAIDTGTSNTGIAVQDISGNIYVDTISVLHASFNEMLGQIKTRLSGIESGQVVFELNTGLTATNMVIIGFVIASLKSLPTFTGYVTPTVLKYEICGIEGAKKADMRTAVRNHIKDLHFDEHGCDALALLLLDKEKFTLLK